MFQNESNKLNHIMQNNLIDKQLVDTTMAQCGVSNLDDASIRDTVKIANLLEKATGEKFIRMEMGVPGLAPSRIGTEAEIEALKHGVAQFYPMLEGYPVLSEEASRFVKNFMDVDIRPEGIIPTVGAMQASYVAFMALTECHKGKDTILFIDPGFPVQKTQLEVIGKPYQTFDIYEYREEKLEAKLREYLDRGNIAGIVYSNPNNPSWVCLTDFELQVIGKLATEYDTIILEDLAYFAMDFRKDLSHPGKAPFQPTVAKYTDNYIFMISSSKLFSYAGQRLGLLCISDITGKQQLFFHSVFLNPDLNRRRTQKMTSIRKPHPDSIGNDPFLPILTSHKTGDGSLGILQIIERFHQRSACPGCFPVFPFRIRLSQAY